MVVLFAVPISFIYKEIFSFLFKHSCLNVDDFKVSLSQSILHVLNSRISDGEDKALPLLRAKDFKNRTTAFLIVQNEDGSKTNVMFSAFAELGFYHFIKDYGISIQDIYTSFSSGHLRSFSNPAKSGSLFFLTSDDTLLIKSARNYEVNLLRKLLIEYYFNLRQNPRTFLVRYVGLYCYRSIRTLALPMYFVVMRNLIPSDVYIHEKYDLKGSLIGRKASSSERKKVVPTLKDLDFLENHPYGIQLPAYIYDKLREIMEHDVSILKGMNIIDFSLLLAIHDLDSETPYELDDETPYYSMASPNGAEKVPSPPAPPQRLLSCLLGKLYDDASLIETFVESEVAVRYLPLPGMSHDGHRLLIFVGIIDILQPFDIIKKMQFQFQSIKDRYNFDKYSIVEPELYAKRFLEFVFEKVFVKAKSKIGVKSFRSLFSAGKLLVNLGIAARRLNKEETNGEIPQTSAF